METLSFIEILAFQVVIIIKISNGYIHIILETLRKTSNIHDVLPNSFIASLISTFGLH